MKKIIGFILVVLGLGIIAYFCFFDKNDLSNDKAEKDKNGRYLTIINETNQVINEVHITVNNGTEIESMSKQDIDKKSFSIEIPKEYSKYNTFNVILVDRYDSEYKKTVEEVAQKGRTEVVISKEDIVKESNSWKKKIDRFFNGD